jgi:uncharacterized protein (TIGR02594 family)
MDAPWMLIARNLMDETEMPGGMANPRILEMFKVAGHPEIKSDETAWCAAFVGACLRLSGFEATNSLLARSYADFGRELTTPEAGCIVYLRPVHGIVGSGHVGFFMGREGSSIVMLGGNQSDQVKVSRFPVAALGSYRFPTVTAQLPQSSLPNILALSPAAAPPHLKGEAALPVLAERADSVLDLDLMRGGVEAEDALSMGASGAAVRSLQTMLTSLNYHLGEIDGEFGPLTRDAVLAFQADNTITPTGVVDAATRVALTTGGQRPAIERRKSVTVDQLRARGSRIIEWAEWLKKVAVGTGALGALGFTDANFQVVDRVLAGAKTVLSTAATTTSTSVGAAGKAVVTSVEAPAVAIQSVAPAVTDGLGPALGTVKMLLSSGSGGTGVLTMGAAALLWRTAQKLIQARIQDHQSTANLGK